DRRVRRTHPDDTGARAQNPRKTARDGDALHRRRRSGCRRGRAGLGPNMAEGARPQGTTGRDGVRAARDGDRFLRSDRRPVLWALVPVLVFASLTATLTYLGHRGLAGLLDAGFGGNDAWYAVAGHWVLQLVSAVAALVVALWGALIL